MQYGYFDDRNKEYVITRPDTPAPWCNYLGSPEYGAIISNHAAGYSFVKSGAKGRILRFRFNTFAANQPGRYLYIRDKQDGEYWSNSWQPTAQSRENVDYACHHGTAYTSIRSTYRNIESETLYYVPLNKTYEVWRFKVKNQDTAERNVSVFGFCEFTNDGNYEQDMVNLQYTQLISRTYFKKNMILQSINENCSEVNGDATGSSNEAGEGIFRYFGAAGCEITGFEGDRDTFIGDYRNYGNPVAVEQGCCSKTLNYNGNSCGALQFDLTLMPGEERTITFLVGPGSEATASARIARYEDSNVVDAELGELKDYWHSKLNRFQVSTPDDNLNHSVNVWNAYQCFITFIWSRAASFTYSGLRNGLGYRDTVQDIQGILHLDPDMALDRLKLMLSAQASNGGGLPLVKFDHRAGFETTPDDEEYGRETGHPFYRADDALWLFPTISKYIKESGNAAFIDEVIPYADKGEDTVYNHMKRAIRFSLNHMGEHGLPAGLHADWNDCLRMGHKGESVFVAFQLFLALRIYLEWAEKKADRENAGWAQGLLAQLDDNIQAHTWEGDQFVRGITEDGYVVGSKRNDEGSLWLNPQSWSVVSGAAKGDQGRQAMDKVYEQLNTKYGAMLFYPPFRKFGLPVARMTLMNPSTKENGGIFSQTQGWLILAEAILGNGNRAFEYYNKCNPASMNESAEIRKLEPYAHGQSIESVESPFEGRAQVHWLTGTASTVMAGVVEGILGVQPDYEGLRINPCIPQEWKSFTMSRSFRGKSLEIEVLNPNGVQKGVASISFNGEELESNLIPEHKMKSINRITVNMG
jgi:N,N'-diacetylchitobiose phosphorylase